MSKPTEEEFLADFETGIARMVARECYRAIYPTGMHTNGPTIVHIEASRVLHVLSRWKKQPSMETCECLAPETELADGTHAAKCFLCKRPV